MQTDTLLQLNPVKAGASSASVSGVTATSVGANSVNQVAATTGVGTQQPSTSTPFKSMVLGNAESVQLSALAAQLQQNIQVNELNPESGKILPDALLQSQLQSASLLPNVDSSTPSLAQSQNVNSAGLENNKGQLSPLVNTPLTSDLLPKTDASSQNQQLPLLAQAQSSDTADEKLLQDTLVKIPASLTPSAGKTVPNADSQAGAALAQQNRLASQTTSEQANIMRDIALTGAQNEADNIVAQSKTPLMTGGNIMSNSLIQSQMLSGSTTPEANLNKTDLAPSALTQASGVDIQPSLIAPSAGSSVTQQNTAQMQAQLPANTPSLPDQISIRIAQNLKNGGDNKIEIQLEPAHLGKIQVHISTNQDGRAQVLVLADRQETLEMLQKDARGMERALQDAGVKADSSALNFGLRDQGQGAFAQHNDQHNTPRHALGAESELGQDAGGAIDNAHLLSSMQRIQDAEYRVWEGNTALDIRV